MKESYRKTDANGSLAAACIVLMVGTFGATVLAYMVLPQTPVAALGIFAGAAIIGVFILWLLFPKLELPSVSFSWFQGKKQKSELLGYEPEPMKVRVPRYGTNAPPTAETIHELKDGLNNWVPTPGATSGPKPKS